MAVVLLALVGVATASTLHRRRSRRAQTGRQPLSARSGLNRESVLWTRFFPSGDSLLARADDSLEVKGIFVFGCSERPEGIG